MFQILEEEKELVNGMVLKFVKKLNQENVLQNNIKNSCSRRKCCTYITKGIIKRKVECHFTTPLRCQEKRYTQCHQVKSKYNCIKHECCDYMKKGDYIKKISCKFSKYKKCPEVTFEKCKAKVTGAKCSRR